MMRYLILLAADALAACGTDQSRPAVEIRTVTKTVEVQKPCAVTPPVRPAPLDKPLPTDLGRLVAVLGAKLVEYAGPAPALIAMIPSACSMHQPSARSSLSLRSVVMALRPFR
jgi:hypothetical protein